MMLVGKNIEEARSLCSSKYKRSIFHNEKTDKILAETLYLILIEMMHIAYR